MVSSLPSPSQGDCIALKTAFRMYQGGPASANHLVCYTITLSDMHIISGFKKSESATYYDRSAMVNAHATF
ncbi:hypothetical protein QCA50_005395 [Cerrena zonata]|uniref:Uncharacterized protein n=1 Tax=Cerrena zonata TaxID=2478898 RepID=A0AAW0GRW1_9APHY